MQLSSGSASPPRRLRPDSSTRAAEEHLWSSGAAGTAQRDVFSEAEVAYLRSQHLARVATVSPDGQPDVVPVGFEFDGTYVYVGGLDPAKMRKHRNVQAAVHPTTVP